MTSPVRATIPVSPGRNFYVIESNNEVDPNQINLFDPRRTASQDEKEKWMEETLEIIRTKSEWWPSQLYARLAVLPAHGGWFGCLWKKAEAIGYKKIWVEHRQSTTESANGRAEFLRRKE